MNLCVGFRAKVTYDPVMIQSTSTPDTPSSSPSRPVLLWQEDGDSTRIEPSIEMAAQFLKVSVDDVRAAIEGGDELNGWFADWEAQAAH